MFSGRPQIVASFAAETEQIKYLPPVDAEAAKSPGVLVKTGCDHIGSVAAATRKFDRSGPLYTNANPTVCASRTTVRPRVSENPPQALGRRRRSRRSA